MKGKFMETQSVIRACDAIRRIMDGLGFELRKDGIYPMVIATDDKIKPHPYMYTPEMNLVMIPTKWDSPSLAHELCHSQQVWTPDNNTREYTNEDSLENLERYLACEKEQEAILVNVFMLSEQHAEIVGRICEEVSKEDAAKMAFFILNGGLSTCTIGRILTDCLQNR